MDLLSKLGTLLNDTCYQIEQLARNPEGVKGKQLQKTTSLVNTANKRLDKALKAQAIPEFDQGTIKAVLSDINKLKTQAGSNGARKKEQNEQKDLFIKALGKFQENLKDMAKLQKAMPPVKIEAFGLNKNLVKHLTEADNKLSMISQAISAKGEIPHGEYEKTTKVLDKTNMEFIKAASIGTPLKVQLPSSNLQTIQRILQNIHLIQGVVISAGTYTMQVNRFRESLKELEERLRVLNILKRSRGKVAAHVEKESD